MTTIFVVVSGIAIYLLYRTAFEVERARLVEVTQSWARLIESVARFSNTYGGDYSEGCEAATLSQIIDAQAQFKGFGNTGEFTLARCEEDSIVFLLTHRHYDLTTPIPVDFDSELAEPMRRALSGQSGAIVGLDYRGETVLAAYEPVSELNWGVVAKIDLAEINAPFLRAVLIATSSAALLIPAGTILFLRISNPIIRRLRNHSQQLEQTVAERTRELHSAQEQLIRDEKLAVLGQLASGVGHELRNPLGAIKNAGYFLKMALEKPEPEVKETLEILEREVVTSEKFISSLLDFARTKPPVRRKVNINDIVRDTLSGATLPENMRVIIRLDEWLPPILADPDQLSQVFANIILNATQAMPEGGRLVVTSESLDKNWVVVSVADTGVGIPEEDRQRLFEPLFTTKAKGIGLGLALAKNLVEAHEGTIEVQSEEGKGSTFTIRLPTRAGEGK